jgi:hypothetical protein
MKIIPFRHEMGHKPTTIAATIVVLTKALVRLMPLGDATPPQQLRVVLPERPNSPHHRRTGRLTPHTSLRSSRPAQQGLAPGKISPLLSPGTTAIVPPPPRSGAGTNHDCPGKRFAR